MKYPEHILERKSYLAVDESFIEWKLLYEDLRQSMVPHTVRHEVFRAWFLLSWLERERERWGEGDRGGQKEF